jgi:hypothetical protein
MANVKNKIIRGTFGKLWINGIQIANVKSFELKSSMNYEEVDINGNLAKQYRYTGYALSGTMLVHKVNSFNVNLVKQGMVDGSMPDIKFVATLADPDSHGSESIEVYDVSFDEVNLLQFENGAISEESIPFKAGGYKYLGLITD